MLRYVHTNIIAKNCEKMIQFYKEVFGCQSIGETRNLRGEWLDKLTGIPGAHITGEHLALPGYNGHLPTIEIFSYDEMVGSGEHSINAYGFAHLAFEVDNVAETLEKVLSHGGKMVGELVHTTYSNGRSATFVYAADVEGNILELQSWSTQALPPQNEPFE